VSIIMANIAEGFERGGSGEFQQFLAIAKGSVGEVISHLYVALDQGYIKHEEFRQLEKLARDHRSQNRWFDELSTSIRP
jgi:four helix bundle protein